MKKKLVTLLLAVLTLSFALFALTACSEEEGGSSVDNRNFVTLSMWLIWEGHNPDDASAVEIEEKIQEEFNRISMETYSTKVVFTWFASEEAYKTALAQKYQSFDPDNVNPDVTDPSTDSSEQGTVNDDYPELLPGQLDLVLMLDKEMLYSYVQDENGEFSKKLVPMDTFLKGTYKNVHNELRSIIEQAKVPTVTPAATPSADPTTTYNYYAIPNMNSVGQYTYLKVNKAIAEHFHYNKDDVDTLVEVMKLLNEVESSGDTGFADYALLKEAFPYFNSFFFTPYAEGNTGVWDPNNQTGTNGLLAFFWANGKNALTYGDIVYTLEDESYLSYLALMNWCEATNNFSSEKYIASVEKGDYKPESYDDGYYYITLDAPRMTDADLYSGMWAISAYTANAARAMEIIDALETKTELLNTLVYGVEGDHYSFSNSDKTVQTIGSYYMNPKYVGNLCYVYADKNQTGNNHGFSVEEKACFMEQKTQWMRDLCVRIEYQPELINAYVAVAEGADPILHMNAIQDASDDIFAVLMADTPEAVTLEAYVSEFKTLAKATMDARLAAPVNPADDPALSSTLTVRALIEMHRTEASTASGDIYKNRLAGNVQHWTLYQLVPAG